LSLKILADENVDFRIVKQLREAGITVLTVVESSSGISDIQVMELALKNDALILTEDSDFGELVFSYQHKNTGIIFIRYVNENLQKIVKNISVVLAKYGSSLYQKFTVITPGKIRVRDL
jgi:predicted nuclease of predicted toxin-antitoxin system